MADTNNNQTTETNVQATASQATQPAAQQQQSVQSQQPAAQQTTTPPVKTFTQDEVNAIAAREKREGAKSALNKYGLTEEQLAAIAQALNPQPTTPAVNAVDNTEQMRRLLNAETRAELAINGVRADAVDDMTTLVTANIKLDNYTPDDIKEAIKQIKTRFATSFATQTNLDNNGAGATKSLTGGTGGNFAGNTQAAKTNQNFLGGEPGSLGRKLAGLAGKNSNKKG